ncbi:MAG: hypothetical protein AAFP13_02375 [Pseudomonadota bacterium]
MRRPNPSPAEKQMLGAYVLSTAAGGLLGYSALGGLHSMVEIAGPGIGGVLSALASCAGGLGSAFFLREHFGHGGTLGIVTVLAGGFFATALLGIIAGTILLPIFGTMFGPWLILLTAVTKPWLAAPWLWALFRMHQAREAYLVERETIFRRLPRIDPT